LSEEKKITLPTATKLTMADVCDIRLKRHDLHKIRLETHNLSFSLKKADLCEDKKNYSSYSHKADNG
jgi:hypothetical protein